MITIRNCVFETNSSSCHSVTYIKRADLDCLKRNDKVVVGISIDVEENANLLNKIYSDQIITIEEALSYYNDIVKTNLEKVDVGDDEDDYWDDFTKDMKIIFSKAWGLPLLRFIYFEESLPDNFDLELKKLIEKYYFSDFIFYLSDWLDVHIESYKSLYTREGEARIEYDKRRSLGKNSWRKISTIISC